MTQEDYLGGPVRHLGDKQTMTSIFGSTPVRQHGLDSQPIKLAPGNSMKDSGIGTTYLAVSSGSSSSNTSPESDKDALIQNGKGPRALKTSEIDASSTPATLVKVKRYEKVHQQPIPSIPGALCLEEIVKPGNKLATPIALQKRAESESKSREDALKPVLIREELPPSSSTCVPPTTDVPRRRQRRIHTCEHCEKQFDRPSLLKRHTLTHTGERPFECRYCNKGFSTRSGVNTHERTHTGQRPYVCRICGRRFAAGSNLIFHKYTHTNTRRHQCSHCPKAFVTPGDLRKHEYTHTGEWPFRCTICSRGFATERTLKSHEVTHTGQKPHCCRICGKGYAQESSMKTHMRSHQLRPQTDIEMKTEVGITNSQSTSQQTATSLRQDTPGSAFSPPIGYPFPSGSSTGAKSTRPVSPPKHQTTPLPQLTRQLLMVDQRSTAAAACLPIGNDENVHPASPVMPPPLGQVQSTGPTMPQQMNSFYGGAFSPLLQLAQPRGLPTVPFTPSNWAAFQQYHSYYHHFVANLQQQFAARQLPFPDLLSVLQAAPVNPAPFGSASPSSPFQYVIPTAQSAGPNGLLVARQLQQPTVAAPQAFMPPPPLPPPAAVLMPSMLSTGLANAWPTQADVFRILAEKPLIRPWQMQWPAAAAHPPQASMPAEPQVESADNPDDLDTSVYSQSSEEDEENDCQTEPLDYSMHTLSRRQQ